MGFILPGAFPFTTAARPSAGPSVLRLCTDPLPCGCEPAVPHDVLTCGEGGVFSLEKANPSEVLLVDSLDDAEPAAVLGYLFQIGRAHV